MPRVKKLSGPPKTSHYQFVSPAFFDADRDYVLIEDPKVIEDKKESLRAAAYDLYLQSRTGGQVLRNIYALAEGRTFSPTHGRLTLILIESI